MKTDKKLAIFLGIICHIIISVNCDPIAYVGDSKIIGQKIRQTNMQVNQYLGIPYAQAPVGNLRFMKTKSLESLPKVSKAVHQPPACHQYTKNPFPWYFNSTEKSEDCLFLNIWTPSYASPQNTKAVFFWIHGGGFRYGSIRDDLYSGVALAALGDIVVVTVNYRLGPFGFLSSGTDDAPGNAGLWDLLEGLRWVNRNILAFGGDTSRITIGGESAGSMAVAMLAVSPLSKGLFARQILQSGSPAIPGFEEYYKQNVIFAQDLAKLVGCANETYTMKDHPSEVTQCLKNVDAITLSKMDSLIQPHVSMDFLPQYGDEILPKNSHLSIANGEFSSSEMLIGLVRDEGSVMVSSANPDIFGFFGYKDTQLNKTAGRDLMRKISPTFPEPEALTNHYLPDTLPEDAYEEVRHQVHTSWGDVKLACPSVYVAENCAGRGNNVYFYFWVHRPSNTPWAQWTGVAHFSELQFVFGQPVLKPRRYHRVEVSLSLEVIEIWSSFVKHGKPSIRWPLYNKDIPIFKFLGPGLKIQNHGVGPHRQNCNFLRSFYKF